MAAPMNLANATHDKSYFDWLYPELLTKEDLIAALKKRYVKVENIEGLDKDALVDLYSKFIIPLPQRKYRQNRRGREMTKQQILASKKRRIYAPNDTDQPVEKKRCTGNTHLVSSNHSSPPVGDRLKPPPANCIDLSKKTVKLGSSSNCDVTDSINVNKLKLTRDKSDNQSADTSSAPKKLKLDTSNKADSACVESNKSPSVTNTKTDPDSKNATDDLNGSPKKIKKITWP